MQPVINRPDLQSFQQKYGQGFITVFFWVLFFFFMRPLIGMVGWFFGFQLFTDIMIVQGGYEALLELLVWYVGIIVLMGLVLEGWALYNLLRYGRHEKRTHHPEPVKVEDLAKHFQIDTDQLCKLQAARRIVLEHDSHGRLIASRH
ncbi:MAG: poly-beta-1,6-N-acetyl-D-glucosamine biosynthesis protein PgaD [Desulfuromonadales bacterium]